MKIIYHFLILFFVFGLNLSINATSKLSFIPNKGQIADLNNQPLNEVLFVSYQGDVALYFFKDKIAFCTREFYEEQTTESKRLRAEGNLAAAKELETKTRDYRFDIRFPNASPNTTLRGQKVSAHYYNYYLAHCPNGITNVPDYEKLVYTNIFPNIDLVFYSSEKGMKYDFIVHPGGNPNDIQMEYDGVSDLSLIDGQLKVESPLLNYVDEAPYTYQGNGTQAEIPSNFVLNQNKLSFNLGNYDSSKDLIIDPTLYWGTYFNARSTTWGNMATLTSGGFIQSAYQYNATAPYFSAGTFFNNTHTGTKTDILLVKFGQDGQQEWTTVYGGSDYEYLINNTTAVDAADNLYFGGVTRSSDFPTQSSGGYFDNSINGGDDAFILKFDATGNRLWATYFGGSSGDRIRGMECNPITNKLYVVGQTYSSNIPTQTLPSAFNDNSANGGTDIFILRFGTSDNLEWSTYMGGSSSETAHNLGFDASDNLFIVGEMAGGSTPGTAPPLVNPGGGAHFDNSVNGKQDLYINKFNASRAHTWGTYYGGAFNDNYNGDCSGLSIASNNNIFICGKTASGNLPTTNKAGAYNDATHNGTPDSDNDGYIIEFNNNGVIQWATYYGGSSGEEFRNLDHDNDDNLLIGGFTRSSNFPTMNHSGSYNQRFNGGVDGILLWFDPNGAQEWGTCVGTRLGNEDFRPLAVITTYCLPFSVFVSSGGISAGLGMPVADPAGGAFFDNGRGGSFTSSPWLARFDECVIILAAEITEFKATQNNTKVDLTWSTASENNSKGFILERSADGIAWEELGFVNSAGTSTSPLSYIFEDKQPLKGVNYYRLKQINTEDKYTYSKTASAYFNTLFEANLDITIYPNPVKDRLFFETENSLKIESAKLLDMMGRTIKEFSNTSNSIPVEDVDKGLYNLILKSTNKTFTKVIRIQ